MRDRRVTPGRKTRQPAGADAAGRGRWLAALVTIIALWLAAMVVASYLGYEYRTPVRIENWRPDPSVH
jgi:hypothetical protein